MNEIVSGLRFPEGPIAMPDGSVVLVEIERQTLSRVTPEGSIEVIAKLGGGPAVAASHAGSPFQRFGYFLSRDRCELFRGSRRCTKRPDCSPQSRVAADEGDAG